MTRSHALAIVTASCLAILPARTASAQPTEEPDLTGAPRAASSLNLGVDLFAAGDDALGSNSGTLADGTPVAIGRRSYWGGNSQLSFEKVKSSLLFSASGNASFRRFSEVDDGLQPGYSGSMQLAGRMTRRTRFDLLQSASYGPTNATSLFGVGQLGVGSQSIPIVDYRLTESHQLTSTTRAGLSYSVSRRGSLTTSFGFEYAEAPPRAESTDETEPSTTGPDSFRRYDFAERYEYRVSRYSSWYAGYGLTQSDRTGSDSRIPRMHSIDLGLSYGRPLAFSRRTRVSAQIGSQVVQSTTDSSREWRAAGSASLQHEIGRTWRAQLVYVRDSRFVPLFPDPVLNDAVSANLAGNLSRKSTVGFVTNYSKGTVGIGTGDNGYHGTSASASFRYAFLRQLALYAEYFLFDFEFDRGVALADALASGTQRHGLRIGVSIGTGLWGNQRRTPLTLDGESNQ